MVHITSDVSITSQNFIINQQPYACDGIELVHNGNYTRNMLSVLTDCLERCTSFKFAVAFITRDGLQSIFQTLLNLRDNNIRGSILTTDYMCVSDPVALSRINDEFDNIDLRMYLTTGHERGDKGGFHPKGYIFEFEDRYGDFNIIIGSSNLTSNALKINKEWNTSIKADRNCDIVRQVLHAYEELWGNKRTRPYQECDRDYERRYNNAHAAHALQLSSASERSIRIQPNVMQRAFIEELAQLVQNGAHRALLISATGTGKTYATAFALKRFRKRKALFVAHRELLLHQARNSFRIVLGQNISIKLFSSASMDIEGADIVLATMQTLCKKQYLERFTRDAFEIIIIDEAHHVGAPSYQRITEYFKPMLWLGLSGSPDRPDDFDVYKEFDHNIACEMRLQHALDYDMLCPFHYYGIADFRITAGDNDSQLHDFKYLVSEQRLRYILEKIRLYSYSGDKVHGLIFCSDHEEAAELAHMMNTQSEFRVAHLRGNTTSEEQREAAICRLESSNSKDALDYIITVDIFNEGVDIPCVNQVVFLRQTKSPIVFIQQLGRGLRKHPDKDFVVVIDFIGNYDNNYMIPIALSGDNSYNKENLTRYIREGSRHIPGASTVNFDRISRDKIISSIETADFSKISLFLESYRSLKCKLGRIPRLMDFEEHGAIDVQCIFKHPALRSYHRFLSIHDKKDYDTVLNDLENRYIDYVSQQLSNGMRDRELLVIKAILEGARQRLFANLEEVCGTTLNQASRNNLGNILGNSFIRGTGRGSKKFLEVCLAQQQDGDLQADPQFVTMLQRQEFRSQIEELVDYGLHRFQQRYEPTSHPGNDGLVLYEKYTYHDVCRCLDWEHSVVAQNISGYLYDSKTKTCPIFVNYIKGEDIQSTIRYKDEFLGPAA